MTLTATELQNLPAPNIIAPLDFETIFAEIKAEIIRLHPAALSALELESEPLSKLAQAFAYRVLHERALANNQAQSLMLAQASGAQLDQLGALPFIGTARAEITPLDTTTIPPTSAVMESDERFRERLQIALEGYTTAGSIGSYVFHGLAADPDVKDIAIDAPTFTRWTPTQAAANALPSHAFVLIPDDSAGLSAPVPGDVAVTVLSNVGDGTANAALLGKVEAKLNAEEVRPLTDTPRIRAASIVSYGLTADVTFAPGPDAAVVLAEAQAQAEAYVASRHRIGADVPISGLHAAIHVAGVQRVVISNPSADLTINSRQAAYCSSITLNNAGSEA